MDLPGTFILVDFHPSLLILVEYTVDLNNFCCEYICFYVIFTDFNLRNSYSFLEHSVIVVSIY